MDKYTDPIINFLENNEWCAEEPEFICLQYEIVDKMEADNVGVEVVQPIIELMEKYPLTEFGTPGPLTHFIEGFYKEHKALYENLLVQSVRRSPAVHTIWLLNRLINANSGEVKKEYIQIMKSVYNNEDIHEDIRAVTKNFLEYQKEL